MIDIVFTLSKYLIIICFILFVLVSFRVQRDIPEEMKTKTYRLQRSLIIVIHAVAFFVICLHILNKDVEINIWYLIAFYIGQLAYLLIMTMVIPRYVRLNQGINNVMCMFLTIGFIIQTRLDFNNSLKQSLIVLCGTILFLFICFFCKRAGFLKYLTWVYCLIGMGLLLLVLILSTVSRGAKLSLELGPFSFQPLEFVKILFVLFVAGAFHKSSSFKNVVITAVCAAIHVGIQVLCNDLGSAFILFMIYLLMLYVATRKFLYIVLGTAAFAAAGFAAYKLFDHVKIRVSVWIDPWKDINDKGYQIAQSLFAIGTGGWFGSGLFKGNPSSIPLVSKDMVISAISEELGAIFAIFLILLCLCFVLMIFRVSIRISTTFNKLLAFGLGVSYAVQVFLTIGGALKFIPLTGVTLPFISSGGSSMLASLITVGIIQALYVISESDVAKERRMIAAGIDIEEFERRENGYEEEDEGYIDDEGYGQEEDYTENEEYDEYDLEQDYDEFDEDEEYIEAKRRITYYDINEIHDKRK